MDSSKLKKIIDLIDNLLINQCDRLAKYLELLNMPDEFRELLDEYMDASERSLDRKECKEIFQCPYSLRESVKRNFSGNSL